VELTGSYLFPAEPKRVWDLLVDPQIVAACVPGCDRLEPIGPDHYKVEMTLAVAAISGRYGGTVTIADQRPPLSYRLLVEGTGKAGFVKGEATVELHGADGGTRVDVQGHGQVGGLIARVGQRLLGSVSKMMMDRFFNCVQGKLVSRTGDS
jgi:hypothetical protein